MPTFNLPAYRENNIFWQSGYAPASTHPASTNLGSALGNCTWYVNGRLQQLGYNTTALNKLSGNASEWDNQAAAAGIYMSNTPQVGDIAQWETGHVAVVEKVNTDGTILISESSYTPNSGSAADYLYKTETISASSPSRFIRLPYSGAVGVVKPINITPIDDNSSNPNSVIAPFWGTITGNTSLGTKSKNIGLVFADGASKAIDPSKNTWLVIHGMVVNPPQGDILDERKDTRELAKAVDNYSQDDQVLVLDWRSAAYSPGATYGSVKAAPNPFIGASWIDTVADWTANKLKQLGISPSNINLVGHSLGTYVAARIADKLGGINDLIALDPATDFGGYNLGNGFNSNQVNFSQNSRWSWGFYGSWLGQENSAKTATESFQIDFVNPLLDDDHGAVQSFFY